MVREIIHDDLFLQRVSSKATREDAGIAQDLLDTLEANKERCIGLAANMIGELKRIIAVRIGAENVVMYNPEIVKHSARRYKTEEGCLCRETELPCERFESVEVKYRDEHFAKQRNKFGGIIAQAIQHEIDHCDGKLI